VSVQDVLLYGLLPAVTSSQPTAVSELMPITTTAADTAKTINKPEEPIEETQNKENRARELPPVTDARPDLELSEDSEVTEIHGVRIIDLDTDLDAEKPFIEFSDVEPDYTAEELSAGVQTVTTPATVTPTIPEILFEFQEAVVISDDETPPTSVV